MAQKIAPVFEMRRDTYREEDHSTIRELSKAQQLQGSKLSSIVTHMSFSNASWGRQNFPILYSTEGMGRTVAVDNFDFSYPIMGRPKTSSRVARSLYTSGQTPGANRAPFKIIFKDGWFEEQQTLHAKGGITVRVEKKTALGGGEFEYTVKLWSTSKTASCPLDVLSANTVWSGGAFKVPYEDSRGVVSKSYLPGTAKNMTSLVRKGYKLKGNVQNKIMLYTIKADGKTFTYYSDWELYLADLQFKAQCELEIWTSKYGRDANGEFIYHDTENNVGISSNGGIEQQIPNKRQFSELTYNKLHGAIRDVTFNVTDARAEIDILTGTGGEEEIDEVLKDKIQGFTLVDSKFVQGSGYNLMYGGYFKSFMHRDGMVINIIKHPMFDRGYLGDVEEIHPKTGLPRSSHDIYLLDKSVYDGVPNFQMVYEKGREYTEWGVYGSIIPLGYSKSDSRASDRDSSSVHGMKSIGIQILKPAGCLKLECTLS